MNYDRTANLNPHRFGTGRFESMHYHAGTASAPLISWRRQLREIAGQGWQGVKRHAGEVMRLIANPKVLFTAAGALRADGPKAPGPNGLGLECLDRDELWELCDCLGTALASDLYRPGQEHVLRVKKSSGRGRRPIVLMEVQDRVVQKAAALVMSSALEMQFDPLSFAFRRRRTRELGFAVAEQFARNGRPYWLVHDLKNAFGRVPVGRLLDVCFQALPCPRLRDFLARVLPPRSRSLGGIKQGGPLSPLMLEFYLTRFLHVPWRKTGLPTVLLRYADDLLLAAPTSEDARSADVALRKLLTPAGMLLKAEFEGALTDIRKEPAEWLGYDLRLDGGKFKARLGAGAFEKLGQRFILAQSKGRPAERAQQVLLHWFAQLGPSFAWEDREAVIREARTTAIEHGFEELPSASKLAEMWVESNIRWRQTRRFVRHTPEFFVTGPVVPPTPTSDV